MPQQRLYFDYVDDQLVPYWYVLTFRPGEINWSNNIFYFTPIAPFEYLERHEYDDSLISVSINQSDFIVNQDLPNKIGININSVKRRIEHNGIDPDVVCQFVIFTPDLNELMELLPTKREMELLIS